MSHYAPDPIYPLSDSELDDVELVGLGALDTTYGPGDDQLTLVVPADTAQRAVESGHLDLHDSEGSRVARLQVDGSYPTTGGSGLRARVTGAVTREFGGFRDLHVAPAQVREGDCAAEPTFLLEHIPTTGDVDALRAHRSATVLAPTGAAPALGLSPIGFVRTALRLTVLAPGIRVVVVPLSADGAGRSPQLRREVLAAYAPEVTPLPGDGQPAPGIGEVVRADRPRPQDQGAVVFFTGLSGSGKSTIARRLHDYYLQRTLRTVTVLDGDVVRRHLSAGLGFSREDRETNVRRIGWVAAEIARHGGVVICSPIAPFAATRREMRQMVEHAGAALVLVHVATPLEECERRDRKGMYARARRGEIAEFTGISSPYEPPTDADLVIDTTGRTIDDCTEEVLAVLRARGLLLPPGASETP